METPASLSVAARFALLMAGLRAAVAARIADYPITGPMIVYIWTRLNKINQRFQALTMLILAGKLSPERANGPRARIQRASSDPEAAARPWPIWRLLPMHRFAWLCMVAHNRSGPANAAIFGAALRALLADPEMMALIAATPRMGKLLRPLCWALGIEASLIRRRRTPPAALAGADAAGNGDVASLGEDGGSPAAGVAPARIWGSAATMGEVPIDPLPREGDFFATA